MPGAWHSAPTWLPLLACPGGSGILGFLCLSLGGLLQAGHAHFLSLYGDQVSPRTDMTIVFTCLLF